MPETTPVQEATPVASALPKPKTNLKLILVISFVVIVVIVLIGAVVLLTNQPKNNNTNNTANNLPLSNTQSTTIPVITPKGTTWVTQGLVIEGKYADPDIVRLKDGRYRMYYGIEPEVPGNQNEIYSAISTDGKTWTQEDGYRVNRLAFPDLVELPDGTWRMYGQTAGGVYSFTSPDGLVWTKEAGLRLDAADQTNNGGLVFESLAAPTTLKMTDGTYMMVYMGRMAENYPEFTPSKGIRIFMWATSEDGINWVKQGIALDTRNSTLKGFADGPDLVRLSDGSVKLYFWGYFGIYESTFANGKFSEPVAVMPTPNPEKREFPMGGGSDPSVIQIGDELYMYYGKHEQGLFLAIRQ